MRVSCWANRNISECVTSKNLLVAVGKKSFVKATTVCFTYRRNSIIDIETHSTFRGEVRRGAAATFTGPANRVMSLKNNGE